jgi:DNA ligase-1
VLFELSYDYVGDLSETVALMWPGKGKAALGISERPLSPDLAGALGQLLSAGQVSAPGLTEVIETLSTLGKAELPVRLARWLDALDETGRWALIKLVTGGLRIGVSARLAKTAVAALGATDAQDIELLWPGLSPPYVELFAWLEGRANKPASNLDPAPFRPRCWRMRSTSPILPRSIRPSSWPNGNGTAFACRP